jgi:hypothetical protein
MSIPIDLGWSEGIKVPIFLQPGGQLVTEVWVHVMPLAHNVLSQFL